MGYSLSKEFSIGGSDACFDFRCNIVKLIIQQMKEEEKDIGTDSHNTCGILNVAIVLQDCFNNESWKTNALTDYIRGFIVRFEVWVKKEEADKWNDKENKFEHISAYKKLLFNLKNLVISNTNVEREQNLESLGFWDCKCGHRNIIPTDTLQFFCTNCRSPRKFNLMGNVNKEVELDYIINKKQCNNEGEIKRLKLLLASILKFDFDALSLHHKGAIKELLEYPTDDELNRIIQTGKLKGE